MKVRMLYFATLRDLAGIREESFEIPDQSSVADLKSLLAERHPAFAQALGSALFSINREYAFPEEMIPPDAEIALFPPVSGGSGGPTELRVTEELLDLNRLFDDLVLPTTGAICAFTGVVRGETAGAQPHETSYLDYEAYPAMATAKLEQVADEIRSRWPAVEGIAIVQRIGRLKPGTPSVLIACSGGHRDSGVFEAARYGIDRLKQIVPIWKKEVGPDGTQWVEGDYQPIQDDRQS